MTVVFTSDSIIPRAGFSATYTTLDTKTSEFSRSLFQVFITFHVFNSLSQEVRESHKEIKNAFVCHRKYLLTKFFFITCVRGCHLLRVAWIYVLIGNIFLYQMSEAWRLLMYMKVRAIPILHHHHHHHHHVHEGLGVFSVSWSPRWSWSLRLFLGCPLFLRPFVLYCSAGFGILFVSILCACCSHFSWYCFISLTMFCAPVFCLMHWFLSLSSFVIPSKCLKNFICAASKCCSSLFFSTRLHFQISVLLWL